MSARVSLISELEEAIARGSSAQSAETLRRLTDLFAGRAAELNDQHVELFDEVISRLVGEIETKARAELARRLAPIDNAPPNTIRHLANDEAIEVAGPVLLRSKRLADSDLVDIAQRRGPPARRSRCRQAAGAKRSRADAPDRGVARYRRGRSRR